MKYFIYIFSFFTVMSLYSCNDEMAKSFESKPMAMARMNEIVAVSDKDLWDGPLQDSFNYYFQSAYPIMPTPEPMFDVRHFTPVQLNNESLRKELRTYIVLADLDDPESSTTKMLRRDLGEERFLKAKQDPEFCTSVGKDKWARNQILIYLFAKGEDALSKVIRDNYPAVAKRVRHHDIQRLDASIYVRRNASPGMMRKINELYGFTMRIPGDYENIKPDAENFMWLRKDTRKVLMNIVIQKFPYTSENQLSNKNIIRLRDEYGKRHVSSPEAGSYMVTNPVDLPTYDYTYEIDGQYVKEIRGIWEMENDFLGGPYASYIILNKETNEIIFIDTFILGPGQDKRDMMMQLEYIVKSAKIGTPVGE